jgi:hypothetical protein
MMEEVRSMTSIPDQLAISSTLAIVPFQKRTSLWVTTPLEKILVGMTWALKGMLGKTMRMTQSVLRLAFTQLALRAVST